MSDRLSGQRATEDWEEGRGLSITTYIYKVDHSWFLVEGPDFCCPTADSRCPGRVILSPAVRATGVGGVLREELSPWLGRSVSRTWGVGY